MDVLLLIHAVEEMIIRSLLKLLGFLFRELYKTIRLI